MILFTCHLIIQKHSLWTATQTARSLHAKSATRFRDIKITTDKSAIVTRPFPFRQKPCSSASLITTGDCATETGKAELYTGFQIPVALGGMGWRKGNKHQHFIQCSLLKPLTVAERLVNSIWAWSPL